MKYRNEIILAVCFIVGNIVASWPGLTEFVEGTGLPTGTATVVSVAQTTDGLLASATPATVLTRR